MTSKPNKLLERYANDSILLDPNARAARMTAGMAAGLESAGLQPRRGDDGFAGMAMGLNAAQATGTMHISNNRHLRHRLKR